MAVYFPLSLPSSLYSPSSRCREKKKVKISKTQTNINVEGFKDDIIAVTLARIWSWRPMKTLTPLHSSTAPQLHSPTAPQLHACVYLFDWTTYFVSMCFSSIDDLFKCVNQSNTDFILYNILLIVHPAVLLHLPFQPLHHPTPSPRPVACPARLSGLHNIFPCAVYVSFQKANTMIDKNE